MKNRLVRRKAYRAYMDALLFDVLSGEEKEKRSFAKMQKLVEHAYNHTKFYREFYDTKGFHPSMLNTMNDWDKVPALEKDILRCQPDDLISDAFDSSILGISTTSGSTGTPLKVYKDKTIPLEVMGWRAFMWWGLSPAANMAKLHRKAADNFKAKLKNRLMWWPTKRAYLNNAVLLDDVRLANFIDELKSMKIEWLQGYCSTLETVADYIINNDIVIDTVKMVWCTSSPLTSLIRAKLEQAFRCKIMDQYGCNEMWNIAIQRKDEPYLTVCNDYVHVDTVREDCSQTEINEIGDILITDLNSLAYPLIKYRLGDKGSFALSATESKDGYPKLNFVKGRISDTFIFPDGTKVDGVYLTAICDCCPDIVSSYQVYQKADYSIVLRLVLKKGVNQTAPEVNDVFQSLIKTIKGKVACELEIMDRIPTYNGKKRYIISEIALS